MRHKRWIATFVALALLAAGWFTGVQLALAQDADQVVLLNGLREGTPFKLGETEFIPPTGKMSSDNVHLALALADAKLKEQGVTKPTPDQLHGVLIGNAQQPGVLALRAEGRGWRQVAQAMHVKVADVLHAR